MKAEPSALLRHIWRRGLFEFGRRLRRPVEGRFQPYAYTLPDRYPWLFDFAAERLGRIAAPRLLSFGCSRGDEVFSLARRLPRATIKGIDIDLRNIAACRARLEPAQGHRIAFEVASNTRGRWYGDANSNPCAVVRARVALYDTSALHRSASRRTPTSQPRTLSSPATMKSVSVRAPGVGSTSATPVARL